MVHGSTVRDVNVMEAESVIDVELQGRARKSSIF
jgi:hypothetical protein